MNATNKSAFFTGIYSGVLSAGIGPIVDRGDVLMLAIAVFAIGGPAYFLVFGVRREDMVGAWIFRPDLLRRCALCMLGVGCVAAIAQFLIFFLRAN